MAVTIKNIIPRKYAENSQTAQYTAPAATRCVIDKFTVTNNDTVSRTFAANLVASGGSASNSNRVLATRTLTAGECYTCPELVGQVLEAGGFISTLASVASMLTISASGREIT